MDNPVKYKVTIGLEVISNQFKQATELRAFLTDMLEDVNGTQYESGVTYVGIETIIPADRPK